MLLCEVLFIPSSSIPFSFFRDFGNEWNVLWIRKYFIKKITEVYLQQVSQHYPEHFLTPLHFLLVLCVTDRQTGPQIHVPLYSHITHESFSIWSSFKFGSNDLIIFQEALDMFSKVFNFFYKHGKSLGIDLIQMWSTCTDNVKRILNHIVH